MYLYSEVQIIGIIVQIFFLWNCVTLKDIPKKCLIYEALARTVSFLNYKFIILTVMKTKANYTR